MLKAQGLSYREIGESLGWTYTKVNRCITEGRARFLKVYAEIEAGDECERFAPTLAALAAGTATADALLELRPHIRNCPACRATVRGLHASRLGRLAALWPVPALSPRCAGSGPLGAGRRRSRDPTIVLGPGDVPERRPSRGTRRTSTTSSRRSNCPPAPAPRSPGGSSSSRRRRTVAPPPPGQRRRHQRPDRRRRGRRPDRHDRRDRRPLPQQPRRRHRLRRHRRDRQPVRAEPRSARVAQPKPNVRPEPRHRPKPPAAAAPTATPVAGPAAARRRGVASRCGVKQAGDALDPRATGTRPGPGGRHQDFAFEQTAPAAHSAPASAPTNGGGEFAP